MTPDLEFLAARDRVDAWIKADLEVAMSESEYGRALHHYWETTSVSVGRYLAARFQQIPGGNSVRNRALFEALRSGNATSYYKALLEQALILVQAADRAKHGAATERLRITFLPSNSRFAAIYEPHGSKGWFVIAVDWSLLCAVMTLAAVISHCIQGKRTDDGMMEMRMTPRGAIEYFDAHPALKIMLVEGLTPAIVPSLPPKAPIFGYEPHQAVFGMMVLKSMIFGLVAHEYAHASRNHFHDERRATELRSQIEHEADAEAIVFAMSDPWKELAQSPNEYDPQERTFAVAGCLLLQSLLKLLQTGDRIVGDLTGKPPRGSTHPDPVVRMHGLGQIMDLLVPHNTVQRREIDMYASFLLTFVDAIWNSSIEALIDHLRRQEGLRVQPLEMVSNAELRFF